MEYSFDVVAAASALGGAIIGALGAAFRSGKKDAQTIGAINLLGLKVDNVGDTVKLVCDELARRITILENRYQYDGLYFQPRPARPPNAPAE